MTTVAIGAQYASGNRNNRAANREATPSPAVRAD